MTAKTLDFQRLIPDDLHMTTAERLRLVATIIEAEPDHWDQDYFAFRVPNSDSLSYEFDIADVVGQPEVVVGCSTVLCVAGWGVTTSPFDLIPDDVIAQGLWETAGAIALGLDEELASNLFNTYSLTNEQTVWLLRSLADIPGDKRSCTAARAAGLMDDDWGFVRPPVA